MFDNVNVVRNKFAILEIINIVQPVRKRSLSKILKTGFTKRDVEITLKELIKEGRVVKESDTYRLTNYGLKTIIPGELRKLRDKYRMHHLYEIWKGRGGDS